MSALALKLIACVCMLLDHIGYCIPRLLPLRVIGRIAFPLYVFLLTEGFRHTSSRPRYALRLLIFAVIAQPAFGLLCRKTVFFPEGSVMVTLLISFLCLWLLESLREDWRTRLLSWCLVLGVCVLFHLELLQSDYGARGILMAVSFYALSPAPAAGPGKLTLNRSRTVTSLALAFCLLVIAFYDPLLHDLPALAKYVFGQPYMFQAVKPWARLQAFSVLAVPLVFFYNGKKGWTPASAPARKAMQYGFYLYYPAHMLLLYLTIR